MIGWLGDSRAYGLLASTARKWDEAAISPGDFDRKPQDGMSISIDMVQNHPFE